MDIFCDECGDITKAYIPIGVTVYKRLSFSINVCLDCWSAIEKGSRNLKVARMLQVIKG